MFVSDFGDEKDINIDFDYQLKAFDENFPIDSVISHFENLLNQLGNNPYNRICDIDIITKDEKRRVLYDLIIQKLNIQNIKQYMNCLKNK